jgi:DsbC/DsbD-like thiol-disulfide interchange protein
MFTLLFTNEASHALDRLQKSKSDAKRLKAVRKALAYLEANPRHPGLNTHKFHVIEGPDGAEVFEAYAENNTPAAYRIFWCYGSDKKEITILAITAHP